MESPKTLKEWVMYISQIPEEQLIVQAHSAGTSAFIRMLEEDGFTADEISTIHKAFALKFKEDDRRIPMYTDTVINYNAILNMSVSEDAE
jgi:hypothetical protein